MVIGFPIREHWLAFGHGFSQVLLAACVMALSFDVGIVFQVLAVAFDICGIRYPSVCKASVVESH